MNTLLLCLVALVHLTRARRHSESTSEIEVISYGASGEDAATRPSAASEIYEYRQATKAARTRRTQRPHTQPQQSKRTHKTRRQESQRPAAPRKSTDGDAGFLKRLAQFRSALFGEGERMERLLDSVLVGPAETHLTKVPVAKWLPIEVRPAVWRACASWCVCV